MTSAPPVPRLLVSVRDAIEARHAADGGADVVDFKNPDRGSLGRADAGVMQSAIDALSGFNVTLSAAMGEAVEVCDVSAERLPRELYYLKLGLSGLRRSSNWVADWLRARSVLERQTSGPIQWVAVAYADAKAAAAPPVQDVVCAAIETRCAGVLIDTFGKDDGGLLDHLDVPALCSLARSVQQERMFFALAGRLRLCDLSRFGDVAPDVIAVRSAACENADRRAGVTRINVQRVWDGIRSAFDDPSRNA